LLPGGFANQYSQREHPVFFCSGIPQLLQATISFSAHIPGKKQGINNTLMTSVMQ
jgi:hypothetical protein